VNVLDENIIESQRQLLRSWGVPVRQIGHELRRNGMADEEIIPFLLTLRRPTLFTRDLGLYQQRLCHPRYCMVIMPVRQEEAAHFVRRLLRQPAFRTQAARMGTVIRTTHAALNVWRFRLQREDRIQWHL